MVTKWYIEFLPPDFQYQNEKQVAASSESKHTNLNIGQKFNIPFGYHLLTISLTIDK